MVDAYELIEAGPAFTPLRFGLLSVVEQPVSPTHWRLGLVRQPLVCDGADSILALPCIVTGGPSMAPTVTGAPLVASDPFRVFAWIQCSTVGWGDDLADLKARTQAALTNGEARAVEHMVWTGTPTATGVGGGVMYPHLAANTQVLAASQGAAQVEKQPAATVLTAGTAIDVVEAIGLLEGALAGCYGGEGVIHVPRSALAHLQARYVVEQQGQQLRTLGGNMVAAYASNDRMGPDGTTPAAGQGWFYATGAVQVYRSGINERGVVPGEFVGRRDNSTVYLLERTYAVTWDCCLLAAQVQLGGIVSGAVGSAT
jgi:hypothetical protein